MPIYMWIYGKNIKGIWLYGCMGFGLKSGMDWVTGRLDTPKTVMTTRAPLDIYRHINNSCMKLYEKESKLSRFLHNITSKVHIVS